MAEEPRAHREFRQAFSEASRNLFNMPEYKVTLFSSKAQYERLKKPVRFWTGMSLFSKLKDKRQLIFAPDHENKRVFAYLDPKTSKAVARGTAPRIAFEILRHRDGLENMDGLSLAVILVSNALREKEEGKEGEGQSWREEAEKNSREYYRLQGLLKETGPEHEGGAIAHAAFQSMNDDQLRGFLFVLARTKFETIHDAVEFAQAKARSAQKESGKNAGNP